MRVSLAQAKSRKEEQERKKTLEKYIPDVSKALYVVVQKMAEKRKLGLITAGSHRNGMYVRSMLDSCVAGTLTAGSLGAQLQAAVDHLEAETVLQQAATDASTGNNKRQRLVLGECMGSVLHAGGRWVDIAGVDGARICV